MIHYHPLRVKNIKRVTPLSVTISFEIPENLKDVFAYLPGQHITIRKEFNGEEQRRSYSICSSGNEALTIGVKKVKDGLFSRFANNDLREDDILEVHPPEGRFILDPQASAQNILAFAAGSGITPIMSMIKSTLEQTNANFVLVYGNKTPTETMFHDELLAFSQKYPDRFTIYFVYSQSREDNAVFGRIEHSTVNYILKNKHKETRFDAVYICGPEAMIQTVADTLSENGIPKDLVFYELFTTAEVKEDKSTWPEGKTKIKVLVDDVESEFVIDKKQRVLDAVLAQHIDAPYSCQGGICSSCIARLKDGKVEMVKNQILTDSELAEGLILTCQAHPVTDSISVDYDDV